MSKSSFVAAISLLAALPQSAAQSKVSILTGPVGAQAATALTSGALAAGTASAAKPAGSVVSIRVAGSGNATATGATAAAGTGSAAKPAGSVVSILVAGAGNGTATSTGSTSKASGAAGSQNVWVIKVGSGGLTFSPSSISGAQVGDQIQFQFYTGVRNAFS